MMDMIKDMQSQTFLNMDSDDPKQCVCKLIVWWIALLREETIDYRSKRKDLLEL